MSSDILLKMFTRFKIVYFMLYLVLYNFSSVKPYKVMISSAVYTSFFLFKMFQGTNKSILMEIRFCNINPRNLSVKINFMPYTRL